MRLLQSPKSNLIDRNIVLDKAGDTVVDKRLTAVYSYGGGAREIQEEVIDPSFSPRPVWCPDCNRGRRPPPMSTRVKKLAMGLDK